MVIRDLQYLARVSPAPAQPRVAASLVQGQQYYRHLINPALLTAEESVAAARQLWSADAKFLAGIVDAANKQHDRLHVTRALHIVKVLAKTNLAAHWVRRMTEHPDCFIRSMAVGMLCKAHVNPQLIEKQMGSKDARVRANAVEALWGSVSFNSKRLLERAAVDPHHRVSARAERLASWLEAMRLLPLPSTA